MFETLRYVLFLCRLLTVSNLFFYISTLIALPNHATRNNTLASRNYSYRLKIFAKNILFERIFC